jgi:hypothetical protein
MTRCLMVSPIYYPRFRRRHYHVTLPPLQLPRFTSPPAPPNIEELSPAMSLTKRTEPAYSAADDTTHYDESPRVCVIRRPPNLRRRRSLRCHTPQPASNSTPLQNMTTLSSVDRYAAPPFCRSRH